MAKYNIYLDLVKYVIALNSERIRPYYEHGIRHEYEGDTLYILYTVHIEHQLEYHILRLFDLGYTIVKIKPVVE